MFYLKQKFILLSCFLSIDGSLVDNLRELRFSASKDYWNQKQDFTDELFCLCDFVEYKNMLMNCK